MTLKLAGVILVLSIVLADGILALSIKVLADVILVLLLKKLCIGGRVGKCHLCPINKSANRYHLYTIIGSY